MKNLSVGNVGKSIFQFAIPDDGKVALEIFNLGGSKVATLLHSNLEPGTYEVPFHADGLSPGVYFYRLTLGNTTKVKKMIIIHYYSRY